MISEASGQRPQPQSEFGPGLEQEHVHDIVAEFTFAGLDANGEPRIFPVRTFRSDLYLSGVDDNETNIHYNKGVRVVSVFADGSRATVLDVLSPPAGKRDGMARIYALDGFNTGEPSVSSVRDEHIAQGEGFGFRQVGDSYVKAYYPRVRHDYRGSAAADLVRSGELGSQEWAEFAFAQRVQAALDVYQATHEPASEQ